MARSVDELETFYASDIGRVVQSVLSYYVQTRWDNLRGLRIMGCGYAVPYLRDFEDHAERVIAMMPKDQGAIFWPPENKNRVLLCENHHFPIENASVDRLLLIHHLEYATDLRRTMREVWRVLKANGRVLIVVPNRMGAWAHADWSPFGHGTPFTLSQITRALKDCRFVQNHHEGVLFMPPVPDSPVIMRSARIIEKLGRSILPFVAGVHMMEASKQIFATIDKTGGGSAVFSKTKDILRPAGRPVAQNFEQSK